MSAETDVRDLSAVSVLFKSVTAELEASVSVVKTDRLVVSTVVVDRDGDLLNGVGVVVNGNLHGNGVVDRDLNNFVMVGHVDGVPDGNGDDGSTTDDGSGRSQLEQFLALGILHGAQNGESSDENPLVHV